MKKRAYTFYWLFKRVFTQPIPSWHLSPLKLVQSTLKTETRNSEFSLYTFSEIEWLIGARVLARAFRKWRRGRHCVKLPASDLFYFDNIFCKPPWPSLPVRAKISILKTPIKETLIETTIFDTAQQRELRTVIASTSAETRQMSSFCF